MNVLVVGGAGFVGSHLVDELLFAGHRVRVLDDFSFGRASFLPVHQQLDVIRADISHSGWQEQAFAGESFDAVLHLAAIHHIPTCEQKPVRALEVNVVGTQRVLDACAAHKVPRVLFISSGAVYADKDSALVEGDPLAARDVYSAGKLAGETLVSRMANQGTFRATMIRLFNVVGPRETNAHLLPELVAQVARGENRVELGNLHTLRDYVHVQDVAQALMAVGLREQDGQTEIFNVGSGRESSVVDVVHALARACGQPLQVESVASKRRGVDRLTQLANISKITALTGWTPRYDLAQAVEAVWQEHMNTKKVAA